MPNEVNVGADFETSADLAPLRELVCQAFEQARESGRPEWHVMTVAVLKNRLLQLTSREFDEHAYGARSMVELVKAIPETVSLDESARPARVTLLDTELREVRPGAQQVARIRPDLWNAIFDYSSGGTYVWDGSAAVRRPDGDTARAGDALPTLSVAELTAWRSEFVAEHPTVDLGDWRASGFSTRVLPSELGAAWNQFMKDKALERLRAWFATHAFEMPPDAVVPVERVAGGPSLDSETEALRRYLASCVAAMRPGELRSVQIPASVAARIARR